MNDGWHGPHDVEPRILVVVLRMAKSISDLWWCRIKRQQHSGGEQGIFNLRSLGQLGEHFRSRGLMAGAERSWVYYIVHT